jgi:branched-chain amino acid transport system permease protein
MLKVCRINYPKYASFALFIIIIIAIPITLKSPYYLTIGNFIGIYAIAGIGLSLLTGYTGQVSMGQAVFFGIGAYISALLTVKAGFNPWVALIVGALLAASIAFILGISFLKFFEGHVLAVATLGISIIYYTLLVQLEPITGGYDGIVGIPRLSIGGFVLKKDLHYYYIIWTFVLLILVPSFNIINSRIGRALRSIHPFFGGNETAAESLGVSPTRYKVQIFMLSAIYASLAGSLYAHWVTFINPEPFGLITNLLLLIIVCIGGMESLWGAILGTALIIISGEFFREFLPRLIPGAAGAMEVIVYGMILILVLLFMPRGLVSGLVKLKIFVEKLLSLAYSQEIIHYGKSEVHTPNTIKSHRKKQTTFLGPHLLDLRETHKTFGGLVAINRISFNVSSGEILAIIGPNGAGKTTLFNLINGFLPLTGGSIWFKGQNLKRLSAYHIASLRIGRTFQNLRLFTNMSVIENVMMGRHIHSTAGIVESALYLPHTRTEERNIFEVAMSKLTLVGLRKEAFNSPLDLPFGKQKLLGVARALASEPELLLLDEPAGGLSVQEIEELSQLIYQIRDSGITIILVEHRMELVMNIANKIIVLNYGEKIAEGSPAEVQTNEEVIAAYLGKEF